MAGYLGTKAVLLSTTSASVGGDSTVGGDLTVDTNTLFVDSANNNVGIGTSSPSSYNSNIDDLVVYNAASGGITIATGTSSQGAIAFADGTSGSSPVMGRIRYDHSNNSMGFRVNNDEKMSIDDSGNLLVAASSAPSSSVAGCRFNDPNAAAPTISRGSGTTEISMLTFQNGNGTVGQITTNGSATAYLTSSDYRLKEDVQPMTGASDRVLALNPVNFAWKVDGSRVDGFLAHQAQAVVPEAVTGTHNEVDADGNAVMQGIDQSKLVPLLTAALKEAITKIETLETEMTSVKARLDALEGN